MAKTVSLEMAKALKEAGLKWEPKKGDAFTNGGVLANIHIISGESNFCEELGGKMWFYGGQLCSRDGGHFLNETTCYCMNEMGFKMDQLEVFRVASKQKMTWLPTLSDLLDWLESKGYIPELLYSFDGFYNCILQIKTDKRLRQIVGVDDFAGTREDAAAKAVLWVLRGGKEVVFRHSCEECDELNDYPCKRGEKDVCGATTEVDWGRER